MAGVLRRLLGLALLALLGLCGLFGGVGANALDPVGRPFCAPARGGLCPTSLPVVDHDLAALAQRTRARLHADQAHRVCTGRGVRVAVLDGGFDLKHPDLVSHLAPFGFDAVDGDEDAHDPGNGRDDDGDGLLDRAAGHGTFVAGMVLLAAPDATIVPIRVRDDEGWGSDAAVLRGLAFARARHVEVVNLSLSTACERPEAILALMAAMQKEGTTFVVSAGNDGRSCLPALACLPCVLVAVALDEADLPARFSNRLPASNARAGAWLVGAPGVDLAGPLTGGQRGRWSGTSFSAGLVSGAAALARAAFPSLSGESLRAHIHRSMRVPPVRSDAASALGCLDLLKVVSR